MAIDLSATGCVNYELLNWRLQLLDPLVPYGHELQSLLEVVAALTSSG